MIYWNFGVNKIKIIKFILLCQYLLLDSVINDITGSTEVSI